MSSLPNQQKSSVISLNYAKLRNAKRAGGPEVVQESLRSNSLSKFSHENYADVDQFMEPSGNNNNLSKITKKITKDQEYKPNGDALYKFFGNNLDDNNLAYVNSMLKNASLMNTSNQTGENQRRVQPVKAKESLSTILKDNKFEQTTLVPPPNSMGGHHRAKSSFQSPPQNPSHVKSLSNAHVKSVPGKSIQAANTSKDLKKKKDGSLHSSLNRNKDSFFNGNSDSDNNIPLIPDSKEYSSLRNAKTEANEESTVFDGYKKPLTERFKGDNEDGNEKNGGAGMNKHSQGYNVKNWLGDHINKSTQRRDKEKSFLEDDLLTNASVGASNHTGDGKQGEEEIFLKSLDGYLNYFTQNVLENSTSGQSSGFSNIFASHNDAKHYKKILGDLMSAQKDLKQARFELEKYKLQINEMKLSEYSIQEERIRFRKMAKSYKQKLEEKDQELELLRKELSGCHQNLRLTQDLLAKEKIDKENSMLAVKKLVAEKFSENQENKGNTLSWLVDNSDMQNQSGQPSVDRGKSLTRNTVHKSGNQEKMQRDQRDRSRLSLHTNAKMDYVPTYETKTNTNKDQIFTSNPNFPRDYSKKNISKMNQEYEQQYSLLRDTAQLSDFDPSEEKLISAKSHKNIDHKTRRDNYFDNNSHAYYKNTFNEDELRERELSRRREVFLFNHYVPQNSRDKYSQRFQINEDFSSTTNELISNSVFGQQSD